MVAHQPIRRRSNLLADNETTIGEPMSCRPVSAPSIPLARYLMWRPLLLKPAEADTLQDVKGWRVWKMLRRKNLARHIAQFRPHSRPCETKTAPRSSRQHLRRGVKSFQGFAHNVSFTRFIAGPLIKLKRPAAQTYFFPGSCFPASSGGVTWSSSF